MYDLQAMNTQLSYHIRTSTFTLHSNHLMPCCILWASCAKRFVTSSVVSTNLSATLEWIVLRLSETRSYVPLCAVGETGLLPPRERASRRGVDAGVPADVVYLVDLKQ